MQEQSIYRNRTAIFLVHHAKLLARTTDGLRKMVQYHGKMAEAGLRKYLNVQEFFSGVCTFVK